MTTFKPAALVLALAVTALTVGGCADTLDKLSAFFDPARDGPAVNEDEIAALAEFPTAAGKTEDSAVAALTPAKKEPASSHPAARHIEKLGIEVIAVLEDTSMSKDQRIAYFRDLLARDLDIPLIARFVTGKHWRSASPDQRRSYLEVFTGFVVQTYSARLGGADVGQIQVLETQPVGKSDVLVHSRVIQSHGAPLRADWRLTNKNGTFRILDLSIEGISMALTLRQEFSSVLRRKGGVDGLIAILREKAA
jgi:phospholipid transport system substrate-binding protein